MTEDERFRLERNLQFVYDSLWIARNRIEAEAGTDNEQYHYANGQLNGIGFALSELQKVGTSNASR